MQLARKFTRKFTACPLTCKPRFDLTVDWRVHLPAIAFTADKPPLRPKHMPDAGKFGCFHVNLTVAFLQNTFISFLLNKRSKITGVARGRGIANLLFT